MYCGKEASPTLPNCTITRNLAVAEGGAVYCQGDSSPALVGCILWGNLGGSFVVEEGCAARVSYSCLETSEVWPGEGNLNADPLLCGGWETREVVVNDQPVGVRPWPPFAVDITAALRPGANRIALRVTNSLANWLDSDPRPSGLLAPVDLQVWGG